MRVSCLIAAALVAHASTALADSEADRLFKEGKAALEAKRYDEACEKLSRSQQLDAATGTLLALALCHEGQGKTATAWREFNDVAAASARSGRSDRVHLARSKAAALEPKLARMVIAVSSAQPSDVKVDAVALAPDQYNRPFVVDPGEHEVTVTAAGKKAWSTRASVAASATTSVSVPPLEDAGAPADAPVPSVQPGPSPQRVIGWSLIGAGAVSFVVGTIFGIRAVVLSNDAKARCPTSPCSDSAGVGANQDAQTSAWVANFGIGLGIVAAAAGVVVLVTAPRTSHAIRVTPVLTGREAGATLSYDW